MTAPTWRGSCAKAIERDRFPLSPRVQRLKALPVKLDPAPAPTATPLPAPKAPGEHSALLGEEAAALDANRE